MNEAIGAYGQKSKRHARLALGGFGGGGRGGGAQEHCKISSGVGGRALAARGRGGVGGGRGWGGGGRKTVSSQQVHVGPAEQYLYCHKLALRPAYGMHRILLLWYRW